MKVIRIIFYAFLCLGLYGILNKILLWAGANYWVVLGFTNCVILSLVQLILCVNLFKKNSTIVLFFVFTWLMISFGFFVVMSRYLFWSTWFLIYLFSGVHLILSVVMAIKAPKLLNGEAGVYFRKIILIPWITLFVLTLPHYIFSPKQFYNHFSSKRLSDENLRQLEELKKMYERQNNSVDTITHQNNK